MIDEIDLSEDVIFDDVPDYGTDLPYEQEIIIDNVPDVGSDLPDASETNSGNDSQIDNQGGDLQDNVEVIDYTDQINALQASLDIIKDNQKIIGDNINLFSSVSIGISCMIFGGIVAYMFLGKIK